MKLVAVSMFAGAAATHYEKPPCGSDEFEGQIQGTTGVACFPKCTGTTCPTDPPSGVTATPQCAIQDTKGNKYCGLICSQTSQCDTAGGSTCQMVQGTIGLCMYPKQAAAHKAAMFQAAMTKDPIEDEFEAWMKKFGKTYNGDDQAKRFGIYKANDAIIKETNAKDLTYNLGHNQFSDLTVDEFKATYMGFKKPAKPYGDVPYLGRHEYQGEALADSVDWTTKGAVTPVKNQGQCGSCWSFSTTGSLEGAHEITTGKLVSLSEQQFVDCAGSFGNQGCNGGLMDSAFKYAEANGICTEASYPYKGVDGTCQASSCTIGLTKGEVSGYKDVAHDSEQGLMSAVQKGPTSIALDGASSAFQLYHSGVLTSTCGTQLDHGVLAVGYGTESGTDYWKVKNSWGASWGEEGYILLKRGKSGAGECGLLSEPSYPVVNNAGVVV